MILDNCWKPLCSGLFRSSCHVHLYGSLLLTVYSKMTIYYYYIILVTLSHQTEHSTTHHWTHSHRSIGLHTGPESHGSASALVCLRRLPPCKMEQNGYRFIHVTKSQCQVLHFWFLHFVLASCGAVYCNRSSLWVCVAVFVCLWVCYHDNSKLHASILAKLGL